MKNPAPPFAIEAPAEPGTLPGRRIDLGPIALLVGVAIVALPLTGSVTTWITLTIAGLAMGMMLFIMASGLTLVFGLMDVLNLGHAAFVALGAYVAATAAGLVQPWLDSTSGVVNILAVLLVGAAAVIASAAVGFLYERLFIRPVYGSHLKQILITIGAMLVMGQLLLVVWGPNQVELLPPALLRGVHMIGPVAIERYRIFAVVVGLVIYAGMMFVMHASRVGLLIRAGVENREMVEALGHHIRRLFVIVCISGSALAGLGGAMWGFYREEFGATVGSAVLVQILIITIVGGLGSITGCLYGAMLIALSANYLGFFAPDLAVVSDIIVMMGILLWRPNGLHPVAAR
jgi:branched-chain amino acid transport system permease protein